MGTFDEVNIRGNSKISVIIEPNSKDGVVGKIKSKVNTEIFYKLNLFIFKNNYAKNLLFRNLANILANFLSNLSSITMNFGSFFVFFISFSYLAASNCTSGSKLFDFTSSDSLVICNPSNIFVFYH